MASSQATQPTSPGYTYEALVNGIVVHPLFPLIIKKVFDVCQSNAFERSHLIPHFTEEEGRARGLQNCAQQHGLAVACERWASTDVFMSALVASLNQVSAAGAGDNVALRHTIAAGQTALSAMWTDPRYIGDTEARQGREEVQSGDHGPRDNIAPRPSAPKGIVDSAQRSDEQPSVGAQRGRATTRRALSDKAKQTLERWFQEHISDPYPTKQDKEELGALCDISLSSVNNWFGNKRMRVKRKMLQVTSHHQEDERITDKVLAPKSKWNAVVVSKIGSQAGRDALESATGASVSTHPIPEGGPDGRLVVTRGVIGSSGAPSTTTDPAQVDESSEMTRSRRSRRRQGQPGLPTLASSEKASAPEPPPTRDNFVLPREGHLFSAQLHVGLPVLPCTATTTGQFRDGVAVPREGQALQSQTQARTTVLPSTVALTGRIRDGADVYREGQSLPPMGPIGPSVLPSIALTTEQARNSSTMYRGGHPLAAHSLGGSAVLHSRAVSDEARSIGETRRETRAMRIRQREGPSTLLPAAKLPGSRFTSAEATQEQTQEAQEGRTATTQRASASGLLPDIGSTGQDSGEVISSQTRGQTEQTQHEDQAGQAGPSRSIRRTKRRKVA